MDDTNDMKIEPLEQEGSVTESDSDSTDVDSYVSSSEEESDATPVKNEISHENIHFRSEKPVANIGDKIVYESYDDSRNIKTDTLVGPLSDSYHRDASHGTNFAENDDVCLGSFKTQITNPAKNESGESSVVRNTADVTSLCADVDERQDVCAVAGYLQNDQEGKYDESPSIGTGLLKIQVEDPLHASVKQESVDEVSGSGRLKIN
jgi:hypothetical protein